MKNLAKGRGYHLFQASAEMELAGRWLTHTINGALPESFNESFKRKKLLEKKNSNFDYLNENYACSYEIDVNVLRILWEWSINNYVVVVLLKGFFTWHMKAWLWKVFPHDKGSYGWKIFLPKMNQC